jgi:tetratricopeptide (TPR) repeat protein
MVRSKSSLLVLLLVLNCVDILAAQAQQSDKPNQPPTSASPVPAPTTVTTSVTGTAAAEQLFRTGKFAEAEGAYNAILQSNPKSTQAYIGLFRVLLRERRSADATNMLAKAAAMEPNSDAVRTAQGEMHFRQGGIQEAQADFTALVKAGTSEPRAYLGLARVYWAESLYQHAKLLFDMAHERDPDDPEIRKHWLFTLTGKELQEELKRYLASATNDEEDERDHLEAGLIEMNEDARGASEGCKMVSDVTGARIPMQRLMSGPDNLRGTGLKVQLNNVNSNLLLDSGSSGILVSRKIAQRAGIKPIAETDVHGIGDKGTVKSFVGVADTVKIGALEFHGCYVEVMDRNSVIEEEGLIGPDFFWHFLVNINFPDNRLELTPLPPLPPPSPTEKALVEKHPEIARFRDGVIPPEFKSFTRIYRFEHFLLIPTRINDLPPKLFLIDTGAFSDMISPDAAREVTKVRGDNDVQVKGLNGEVKKVFSADELTLRFSHFKQPAKNIVAFDTSRMSSSTDPEISGALGFAMLYQMQLMIDYRDGLVDFVYDPHRLH